MTAVPLFSMVDGPAPAANVLGVSDPDVHLIDGRWTMFLGGFTVRMRNELFSATLLPGAPLDCDEWTFTAQPGSPRRALPLVPPPPRGQWDQYGMHTPCYVEGPTERRVYYAGRRSRSHTGPTSRYAVGVLRQVGGRWVRHGPPVMVGTAARPSALEPLVRYDAGVWRMWFLSTVGEPGPGELPDYRILYSESADGLTDWSPPQVFFDSEDGYFDADVQRVGDRFEMIVARGTNLHGTPGYPAQGLWWLESTTGSGLRGEWTETPVRLLDTDADPVPWFGNGTLGPSFRYDADTLHVFCTGTHTRFRWLPLAARRLLRGRRPPVPAPFHLTTGRIALRRPESLIVERVSASPEPE